MSLNIGNLALKNVNKIIIVHFLMLNLSEEGTDEFEFMTFAALLMTKTSLLYLSAYTTNECSS
jgi:hypothetical protein